MNARQIAHIYMNIHKWKDYFIKLPIYEKKMMKQELSRLYNLFKIFLIINIYSSMKDFLFQWIFTCLISLNQEWLFNHSIKLLKFKI